MPLWLPKAFGRHGPSYPGPEDCRHHFNHVEERGEFRPQTVASASSLSISGEEGFPFRGFSPVGAVGFRRCSVREEYQSMRSAPCAWEPSYPLHAMPPRITRNSHRPRASDRTMLPLKRPVWLAAALELDGIVTIGGETHENGQQTKPLQEQAKLPWAGDRDQNLALRSRENFFLDIPFYRTH